MSVKQKEEEDFLLRISQYPLSISVCRLCIVLTKFSPDTGLFIRDTVEDPLPSLERFIFIGSLRMLKSYS